jgi:Rrf2 family protein
MANAFKVSEAASLALHSMAFLAEHRDRLVSAHEMASALRVSEAHLSKVLQRLARAGLVKSTRGPKGGFTLGRPRSKITLLEVYETIEGPLAMGSCLLGSPVCGGEKCIFGGLLRMINKRMKDYLAQTRLPELGYIGRRKHGGA